MRRDDRDMRRDDRDMRRDDRDMRRDDRDRGKFRSTSQSYLLSFTPIPISDKVTSLLRVRNNVLSCLQGDTCGRGKAFVDVKVGSSDHQLSCWAATVTGGTDTITFNRTFFRDHTCHPVYSLILFNVVDSTFILYFTV